MVKASFWERERERERELEAGEAGGSAVFAGKKRNDGDGDGGGSPKSKWQRVVPREHVNLLKGRYADDHRPIDEECGCPTCKGG